MISFSETIGLIGFGLALLAYGRVQWRRDFAKTIMYSLLNLLSALFMLYSLAFDWNLASAVGNAIWAAISLYGIYRCLKYKLADKRQAANNP